MMVVMSSLLSEIPDLIHGFGTRDSPIPKEIESSWIRSRPRWRQVHGVSVAEVQEAEQECGEIDAIFARRKGLPIAVVTADCVPILLARRKGGAVAAVHAGWRGTRARILTRLWDRLSSLGEEPSQWVAAIGPAIGPCCYEVSEELGDDFAREFGSGFVARGQTERPLLDLSAINEAELRRIGLGGIEQLRNCTRCSVNSSGEPLFHSFRREGGGTRQYSMILAV